MVGRGRNPESGRAYSITKAGRTQLRLSGGQAPNVNFLRMLAGFKLALNPGTCNRGCYRGYLCNVR